MLPDTESFMLKISKVTFLSYRKNGLLTIVTDCDVWSLLSGEAAVAFSAKTRGTDIDSQLMVLLTT